MLAAEQKSSLLMRRGSKPVRKPPNDTSQLCQILLEKKSLTGALKGPSL